MNHLPCWFCIGWEEAKLRHAVQWVHRGEKIEYTTNKNLFAEVWEEEHEFTYTVSALTNNTPVCGRIRYEGCSHYMLLPWLFWLKIPFFDAWSTTFWFITYRSPTAVMLFIGSDMQLSEPKGQQKTPKIKNI